MMETFLQSQSPHPSLYDGVNPEIPYFLLPEDDDDPPSCTDSHPDSWHSLHPANKAVTLQGLSTSTSDASTSNLAKIDWLTDEYCTSEPKPVEDRDVERLYSEWTVWYWCQQQRSCQLFPNIWDIVWMLASLASWPAASSSGKPTVLLNQSGWGTPIRQQQQHNRTTSPRFSQGCLVLLLTNK